MAKSSCLAKLWDHCLELEAYIRSHTALDKYEHQGQVPEMIVLGQAADISPFVEHPFYAWVKFWDNLAKYPEPKEQLSRWLGPAINIGPALTAKILKSNRQVLYMSTYHGLTDDEHYENAEVQKQKLFDSLIKSKLGSPLSFCDLQDLDPNITTPHYELYEDDFESHQHVPDIDNDGLSFMRMISKLTNMFLTLTMMSIQKQGTHTLGLKFCYLMGILNRLAKLSAGPGIRMVN